MKHSWITLSAVTALALVACKSKSEPARDDPPKVVEPGPTQPEPPAAKPATPAELVAQLAACTDYVKCSDLEEPLAKGGAAVAPGLVKVAIDATKSKDQRETATKALVKIKAPGTGMALFDAAKAEKDFLIRGPLFAASAASGDDAVLDAAKAYLMTDQGWDERIEVNKAVVPFGKKVFDWAAAEIVKAKKFNDVSRYGDLLAQTATAAEVPMLKTLLTQVTEQMAKGDIAEALIKLGDPAGFDVIKAGLGSKDNLERNNAGHQLESVVDKVPADRKAEFAALVEAAKKTDTASTYNNWDALLTKLK